MQRLAVGWLVYNQTHSGVLLGVVTFSSQIPALLLATYGGTISDRYNRYRVLLLTQVASLVQAAALAALVLSGHYSTWAMIGLSLLLGTINAFDIPARQSLIAELVEDRADLANAIALNSTMVNLARLVGPAVAGLLLTHFGEGICFLVNAISFVGVIASLLLMRLPARASVQHSVSAWQGLQEGYSYLNRMPELLLILLLMACVSFVMMPFTTLLPMFAKDVFHGNAATFSWLNSTAGLGALCGAVYLATLRPESDRGHVVLFSAALFGLGLLAFACAGWFPLALGAILFVDAGMMMDIASTNTFLQLRVADHMRGRVLSYYVMAFQGMQPLGSLLVGWVAHRIGPRHTVFGEAVLGLVIVAVFAFYYRKARQKQPVQPDALVAVG